MVVAKVDMEALKNQEGGLSDDQSAAIAAEALAEIQEEDRNKSTQDKDAPIPEEKDEHQDVAPEKQETDLSDDEILSLPEEGLNEAQKAKKITLVADSKKKQEETLLNAKDEDLSAEDKTKKAEIVKARETEKAQAEQAEIETYAKDNNVSIEEAKADLESIAKIQEKYKGDPKQLAKANLGLQRIWKKTEAESKALKDGKGPAGVVPMEVTAEAALKHMEDGKVPIDGKPATREQIIDLYREMNPDLTETLDDDTVLKVAAKEYAEKINAGLAEQRAQIGSKAKEKRESLVSTLSDTDKPFWVEAKSIIDGLSDEMVMDERFDAKTYISFVKGKQFDTLKAKFEAEKKEYGEKEYNRGLEEAKILGIKRPAGSGGGNIPKVKITTLTDDQKKRAEDMFDNPGITKEKAYQMYREYIEETNSK
jgi:hypothetical protein